MGYDSGQIVRHPTLGMGRVLSVEGDRVRVFFRDASNDPVKVIVVSHVAMTVVDPDAEPWLTHLDVAKIREGKLPQYMTHRQAVEKFCRIFPQGFYDPKYLGDARTGERHYKLVAHELWKQQLNREAFATLLNAGHYSQIAERAMLVEGKTNFLSVFEKSALREAMKTGDGARCFGTELFGLIYGDDPFECRFTRFADMLGRLPQPRSETLKWPIQTIFPFLAIPTEHLLLKPGVTQQAAERRAFSLNYSPRPNWLTYSCLLRLGELLMHDLSEQKPRDMIDIQSFIWVTGEDSYKHG